MTQTIAIIGGGFSGCMTAVHLLGKNWTEPVHITLIDGSSEVGEGLAYSTKNEWHYLNVQSGNMSAFSDSPDDLVRFLRDVQGDKTIEWNSFITRKRFSEYIKYLLQRAIENRSKQCTFNVMHREVDSVVENRNESVAVQSGGSELPTGFEIVFSQDDPGPRSQTADYVVLALGNSPPAVPSVVGHSLQQHRGLIADPWRPNWWLNIPKKGRVLFVGTGLTMIDKALELALSHGFEGRMIGVSRHGYLPAAHRHDYLMRGTPSLPDELNASTVLEGFRWVRRQSRRALTWRHVVDSLRPYTQDWWRKLPPKEQKRFLRHLQTLWDVHRHRMAPGPAAEINKLIADGKLQIIAGRLQSCKPDGEAIEVNLSPRRHGQAATGESSSRQITLQVDAIINCTGSEARPSRTSNRLLHRLWQSGMVSENELQTGLKVDNKFHAISRDDRVSQNLFALGPPLRGSLFETIAVPELRQQAFAVADSIFSQMSHVDSTTCDNISV